MHSVIYSNSQSRRYCIFASLNNYPMSAGGLSVCVRPYVRVIKKTSWLTHRYCNVLTARKLPQNGSLPLGIVIHILGILPRKLGESSVECYAMGF